MKKNSMVVHVIGYEDEQVFAWKLKPCNVVSDRRPRNLEKRCNSKATMTVQSYTSFCDILPYSNKKVPWWKKFLARPSPDFSTNLIVRDDNQVVNSERKVKRKLGTMFQEFFETMFSSCLFGKKND